MTRHISDDDPLLCPRCARILTPHAAKGITCNRCEGCGGLWLSPHEKERLAASKNAARAVDVGDAPAHAPVVDPAKPLICPRDGGRLIRMVDRRQPHIHFESCKVCGGAFLDPGELRDMASFTLFERIGRLFGRK